MTTLLCMGFPDPVAIRKALRLAKNDINEAVALLTNESPGLGYGYEPMESGPAPGPGSGGDGENGGGRSGSGTGGFDPPPAYHDVVEGEVRRNRQPCPYIWRGLSFCAALMSRFQCIRAARREAAQRAVTSAVGRESAEKTSVAPNPARGLQRVTGYHD